jgi:branched-chain amino acid transport system ATP-binding protein
VAIRPFVRDSALLPWILSTLGFGIVLAQAQALPFQDEPIGATAAAGREPRPVAEIYEMFPELDERRDIGAGRLSGGQQQFLAIGRALMGAPSALMLDEPTNGLAPMLVQRVVEILRRLKAENLAILLVEQRLEVAQAVGDSVLLMSHGHIVRRLTAGDPSLPDLAHQVYLGGDLGATETMA